MIRKIEEQIDIDELCHFTEKQKEASRAVKDFRYLLYGGAMGGGKSYFLRWKLLRMLLSFAVQGHHNVTVVLFCEDYPSLKDRHLSKVQYEFPPWIGEYNSTDHNFVLYPEFGNGVLAFRNLEDASKYQSSEFAVIAVDELTKNEEDTFRFLRTRLRWPGIPDTRFIAATNPGGKGHLWVKKLWIDKTHSDNEQSANQFMYIQARVMDNPYVPKSYIKELQSLPDEKRRAFLDGDWDLYEGQYFAEWNKEKHVVEPFEIPDSWKRFRSIDISGRNGITSCHWYALDYDGVVWVYREHYASGMDSDQHADQIREMSGEEEYFYTVIDSSAFTQYGAPETMAEIYMRRGVWNLIPSDKKRLTGWDVVHQYLRWDKNNLPRLRVFSTCTNMIRTIPSLVCDVNNPQDVDSQGEDHAADELRYFLQTLRDQRTEKPMSVVRRRLLARLGIKASSRLEEWNEIEEELRGRFT
ncbi:MAG: phage terminase large subunit [bacterium]|nr:phage terminase large subunit [bacterium]